MEIILSSSDLNTAIQDYVMEKYGMNIDIYGAREFPSLEYQERDYVFKKYKNGKYIKDKNGYKIIDNDLSKYETKYATIDDVSSISVYLD